MTTTLTMPSIGFTSSFSPCGECFEIMQRDLTGGYPGARAECYSCRNVMIARSIETTTQVADRFQQFGDLPPQAEVREILFSGRSDQAVKEWLAEKGLDGFESREKGAPDKYWKCVGKGDASKVNVYVRLDRGVIGRCVGGTSE